jgi:predicted aspartyl protease
MVALVLLLPTAYANDQKVGFRLEKGYLIVVKCSIGDLSGLTGIIDTGVSETVVDTSVVKKLGLESRPDQATFLTREAEVRAVSIPSLRLGAIVTGPLAGIATDLHSLTSESGIRSDVLIGMDVLGRGNLVIDYERRELTLTPELLTPFAHVAPLGNDRRLPTVAIVLQGKLMNLQVDTGSPRVVFYLAGNLPPIRPGLRFASAAADIVASRAEGGDMKLGDQSVAHVDVLVVNGSPPPDFAGLLGPRAIHARRLGLDFVRHILSWE